MSSTAGECTLCQKSLGKIDKREVTTSCRHTFHYECAYQWFTKRKSNDCPICGKESTLERAVMGDKMTSNKQHDSAHSKVVKNEKKSSSTALGDEWECPSCSADNPESARRCQSCGQSKHFSSSFTNSAMASTIDESYDQTSPPIRTQRSYHHHSTIDTDDDDDDYVTTDSQPWNKQVDTHWTCDQCHYDNRSSNAVCKECQTPKLFKHKTEHADHQPKRPLPPVHPSSYSSSFASKSESKVYPQLDDDDDDDNYSSLHLTSDQQPSHPAYTSHINRNNQRKNRSPQRPLLLS